MASNLGVFVTDPLNAKYRNLYKPQHTGIAWLVTGKQKSASYEALIPSPFNCSVVRTNVIKLALNNDADRLS